MNSLEHIRDNLSKSRSRTLERVEDMRDHGLVPPTVNGGGHTLWVLGHLAYIEGLVVGPFMLGEPNPLAQWEEVFDGDEVKGHQDYFPSFDDVLARCIEMREWTLSKLDSLTETDLDREAAKVPKGFEDTFGTYRLCLQYVADHWYMHRGQLADARRAAGLDRMWL